MKRQYEDWKPGAGAQEVLVRANSILAEYQRQGYRMTLRQLYYQFVARGFIPNSQRDYKRLGEILNRGRLAGLVDWNSMEDVTRNSKGGDGAAWEPAELVRYYGERHDVPHWTDQDYHVEVWVEKEALANVVSRAAGQWRVNWMACRGYMSQSELWSAARRLEEHISEGRQVLVLHLGDHDPSGIDMTRDMTDRLRQFLTVDQAYSRRGGSGRSWPEMLELRRIALNGDQIEQYGPPPNPTKLTDSRAEGYIAEYGMESWELDALEPQVLVDLIGSQIEPLIDQSLWDEQDQLRDRQRHEFEVVADNWDEIQAEYA